MGEADFSIDSLCQQLATPRRSLEVAFRERFDTSPSQYLQSLRLKSAADLLQNSPLRIVEIASQCG
ncbi:MAG: helix-turn-helix domain-containing protein, partial [Limnospira sp. PMC 1281.21]|uniref:helix-turn-helix domain-containing protein n=1 Tax=Limnospira sp. PMC 1281.21 TaxID=2981064 RepID=UPI0028E11BF7